MKSVAFWSWVTVLLFCAAFWTTVIYHFMWSLWLLTTMSFSWTLYLFRQENIDEPLEPGNPDDDIQWY